MSVTNPHLLLVIACTLLPGCAAPETGALVPATPAAAPAQSAKSESPVATAAPGLQSDGTYILSPAELALSCKKLTGRTVVRILQIRDYELSRKSSFASRQLQKVATPVFGGSRYGADPDADYRRDRAIVEAYNQRLVEKRCKSFDLLKELQPKPAAESPELVKK